MEVEKGDFHGSAWKFTEAPRLLPWKPGRKPLSWLPWKFVEVKVTSTQHFHETFKEVDHSSLP